MASRLVRFAPGFGGGSGGGQATPSSASGPDGGGPSRSRPTFRRFSSGSDGEADPLVVLPPGGASEGGGGGGDAGGPLAAPAAVPPPPPSSAATGVDRGVGSFVATNAAIAANDGPSLAHALAQSIRHHARSIDGEGPRSSTTAAAGRRGGTTGGPSAAYQPSCDPYADDDYVSLAPQVELNYDKDADPAPAPKEERTRLAPILREYVANAAAPGLDVPDGRGTSGLGSEVDRTVERQQERLERMRDENRNHTLGGRVRANISNWFGLGEGGDKNADAGRSRAVRFDDEAAAIVGDDGGGGDGDGPIPIASSSLGRRAPKFLAPPPSSFRTATRHPSHLPAAEGYDTVEGRLDAPRHMLAARRRHRRNDSLLRIAAALVCFALSLTFASLYGEGRFGLAVSTAAYERKISGRYDPRGGGSGTSGGGGGWEDGAWTLSAEEERVFYPDWWERERGVPDMAAKDVKFAPTVEYHAADKESPRAPGRIETPFFWFVPRSGGNAMRTIMGRCLRLAEASEAGAGTKAQVSVSREVDGVAPRPLRSGCVRECVSRASLLTGFAPFLPSVPEDQEQEDWRFVNVDMTTTKGIRHAKDLELASSGVPDVVISGDIHGVLSIFNNRNRARIFAVLRHPLDRAISKYYADVASDPEVSGMTLSQYVRAGGHRVENNYLTRYLSGRYGGKLEVKHLNLAREFLRRKFLVGLASDLPATANLFTRVFGWNATAASLGLEHVDLCYNSIYNALVEEGSEGWKLLVAQNWFDLKVYEYAEHLFQLQVDELKLTGKGEVESASARRMMGAERLIPGRAI
ncbi:hypothetical protein ACHAWF_010784 [Thalassiosira exigua]